MTDTKIKAQGAKGDDAIAPKFKSTPRQMNGKSQRIAAKTGNRQGLRRPGRKATEVMRYLRKTEWTTQVILIMSYSLWLTERPS